ncbi:MAG: winged helix-turn-helix transcriptional regulator [Trebonia sp.]
MTVPADDACPSCVPSGDPLQPGWLAHLYLCHGLSTYQIAARAGADRQRVTRALHKAGVQLRPRGEGRFRPVRSSGYQADLPRLMRELYQESRLSSRQIAAVLGMPERTVRDRLRRYGIKVRSRGRWNREDRTTAPAGVLRLLYVELGMTAAEAGQRLGMSGNTVLRNAHALGLPVRSGGAVPLPGPSEIELVSALYADRLIAAALTAHDVPQVSPGGSLTERFPEPVPLTTPLVKDLYWACGISLSHIELLTGQPAESIRGFMRRSGISLRPPGGRTPFLRRWRSRPAGGAGMSAVRHAQPALGEQPARDHVGRPVHAQVDPAGADPGASQQCRGPH